MIILKDKASMYTAKKLAKMLGVGADVVRHYTEFGLLSPLINTVNQYRYYDEDDLFFLANTRIGRSLGFSLPETLLFNQSPVKTQKRFLEQKRKEIQAQILELEQTERRLSEVQAYLEQTDLCNDTVNDVRREPIHSIYTVSLKKRESEYRTQQEIAKQWSAHFPYTHVSIKIPKEELNDAAFMGTYSIEVGLGLIDRYAKSLNMDLSEPVESIPGGRFLIIYLKTRDIFSLTPLDLQPLLLKAEALGVRFTHQSSGRLLAIEKDQKGTLYSILIRVRIGD